MRKGTFPVLAILVCCFGLMISFQNCGGDFGIIDKLEAPATLAPAEPLELSSDVTQVQMKLNSNDDMLLPEENIGIDVNLEKQNLQVTDSKASENFLLNRSEVSEIRILLRLIRKIHLSADKCQKSPENEGGVPLSMADDVNPETIVVNTSDEKNIVLGEYVNCKARYDLAKEERRILKRILLRIILKRTQVNCPEIGLLDQPICGPDSYLVKKIDNKFCEDGYKCVKKPKQCLDQRLISPPFCPPNSKRVTVHTKGCVTGYKCEVSHHICPLIPQIAIRCEQGYEPIQVFDDNKCVIGQKCQKTNACPVFAQSPFQQEEQKKCLAVNGRYEPVKNSAGCVVDYKCHLNVVCPNTIRSTYDPNAKKQCLNNGGNYIPIKNKNGCIANYRCVGACPDYNQRRPANWEDACEESGGVVVTSDMVNGCKRPPYCKKPNTCPVTYSPEESKKCRAKGGQYQPNSKQGSCVTEYHCKMVPCPAFAPPAPDFKSSCYKNGGKIVYPKPVNNCPMPPRCERPKVCTQAMPVPSEAMVRRCKITNGRLVVKKDRNNCPVRFVCEGSKEPCPAVSPSYLMAEKCKQQGGVLKVIKNANSCAVGFKCEKETVECPAITHVMPVCKAGEKVESIIGPNGCHQGHKCVPIDPIACPDLLEIFPQCKSGYKAVQKVDNMGCVTGYRCDPNINVCPQLLAIPPSCEHGTESIVVNGCNTGYRCKQPVACLPIGAPAPGFCGDEERVEPIKDKSGCITGFKCTDPLIACIDDIPEKPYCGDSANAQMRKNSMGCFAGWACQPKIDHPHMCPIIPMAYPICKPPSRIKRVKDGNNCTLGYKCVNPGGVVGNVPPKNCTSWFDGCNNCSVINEKVQACTKKACFVMEKPKCLSYSN